VVCTNICWHFYNQWFPRYLTQDLRVSARAEQAILAAFFIAADLGSMLSGWSLRQLTRSGLSLERSRKIVATALGMIVLTATIPAAFFLQPDALLAANEVRSMTEAHPVPLVQIGAFLIVAAATMGGFAIVFQFAQDIVGSRTAQILGFVGCVSWLIISGISELIGRFDLAGPGKYGTLFVMVGCCPLAAALLGWLWPEPNNQIIDHAQSHRVEGAKE
jgi:sugar phosphate permease